MKNLITPTYTFSPGSSGVGTLITGIVNFDIKLLYAVLNVTRGSIVYAPRSGYGYTALNGSTITLQADTSSMSSGDILQFLYDSTSSYPVSVNTGQLQPLTSAQLATVELTECLRQIQGELEILRNTIGQTRVDSAGRLRILLESITTGLTLSTISTLSTLTTLSNQTSIGGIVANDQVPALRRLAADTLLTKITVS
jgi:hypothetical protein